MPFHHLPSSEKVLFPTLPPSKKEALSLSPLPSFEKVVFQPTPPLEKEAPSSLPLLFLKGSYTVEAALVLPLFLFAAITVLSFCRILQVEWGIQTAMHEVVRGAAIAGSAFEPSEVVLAGTARAKIISDGVPVKYIWGGHRRHQFCLVFRDGG